MKSGLIARQICHTLTGPGGINFPVHAGLASIHHAVEEAKSDSSDDHTHIHMVLRSG